MVIAVFPRGRAPPTLRDARRFGEEGSTVDGDGTHHRGYVQSTSSF